MLTRKPCKGDRVHWPSCLHGPTAGHTYVVVRTPSEDDCWRDLCWIRDEVTGATDPFIWRHPEGLNTLAEIIER